jgi:hypothetical protein
VSSEDFNKRIMTPELSEDEMRLLHKEAMELYDLYFKPGAKHWVDVGDQIPKDIFAGELYFHNFALTKSICSMDVHYLIVSLIQSIVR